MELREECIDDYRDEFGLIVQSNGDGGDTACEHSAWVTLQEWLRESRSVHAEISNKIEYQKMVLKLVHKDGDKIRRHPDPKMWYSDWDRGTGDQWQNLIIAAGTFGDKDLLKQMLWGFVRRGFFCTNTFRRNYWKDREEHEKKSPRYKKWPDNIRDLSTIPDFRPLFISLFIRGLRIWPLYPMLFFFDFFDLLLGSLLMFGGGKKVKSGSDTNYIMKTEFARRNMPTPISFLARQIYKKRPSVDAETILGPVSAVEKHFSGKNPPLHLDLKKIILAWY